MSGCAATRRMGQVAWLTFAAFLSSTPLHARVTRVEISAVRQVPAKAGAMRYETVTGTFYGELDPRDSHNRIITDLQRSPRNARGRVEYSATFTIERPAQGSPSNGLLFYNVPNRGFGIVVGAENDGRILVMSGWQGDIEAGPGLQTARVPVARGVTGPVLARMSNVPAGAKSIAISGGFARATPKPVPVSLDTRRSQLIVERLGQPDQIVAARDWAFADCNTVSFPGTPDPAKLCLRGAFDPNAAYVLSYTAKDPLVLGIGFAATRDFVAFLRSGKPDDAGTPNPVVDTIRWTVASGTSQSGNFLRSFVQLGFNSDEYGNRVFDGINDNIAARQVPLNVRFGVPGGAAGRYEAGSEGTLWWARYDDRVRGRGVSSFLDRCTISRTCPKVIETFGSAEFWGLRASPGLVGTDAKADIPLPANVRRYYFPGVTHSGGRGTGFATLGDPKPASCQLAGNPNPSTDSFRVTLQLLVSWVMEGKEPPASRYPMLGNGELVEPTASAMDWPTIPGVPTPDGKINQFVDQDFGSAFIARDVSGVMSRARPVILRIMPSRVPRVNADGNEMSGVPSVQHQVPLGTYTGWNVTLSGYEAGAGCGFNGSFIPFARTKAERLARGDPRPSLEERYTDHAGFVARVRDAATRQQAEGWLNADDSARIIAAAEASDVLVLK